MNSATQLKLIEDFFQVFVESVSRTLKKNLDEDVCTKIQFAVDSVYKTNDAESLKDNNAIFKIDYATGKRQGTLIILLPEEIIAIISDTLTGGSGKDAYRGSLSEIETNSISKILEKLFKNLESDFKRAYEHDLIFSADSSFLLKEMSEYSILSDNANFDLVISNTMSLTEEKDYKLNLLLSSNVIENLMNDIGLSDEGSIHSKSRITSLNVDSLSDIKINITAELGRTRVPIKYALELVRGSMIELDTVNNADIKVFANGVEFAYAQIVAVEDNFGLKITKIISPEERLEKI